MRWTIIFCAICLADGSPVSPVDYDTIVVGLGAAGVSCASQLARAGRRVLGLEAQPRLGGRVHTASFGDGHVELGAEWIHGTEGSSVYKLAIDNNVTILPQVMGLKMFWSNGTEADSALINELTTFCLEVANEPPPEPEPLGQYITRRLEAYIASEHPSLRNDTEFLQSFLKFMDLVINNYESSNSWNDVSTGSAFQELGGNQLMSWHKHGYRTLLDIMLNTYKNGTGLPTLTVKLATEVTRIAWGDGSGVKVTTSDGVYTAHNVVVTLSLGVLKERHASLFSPPLPAAKVTAINTIGFGVVAKVTFRFPAQWCRQTFCGVLWSAADEAAVSRGEHWITRTEGVTVPMQCDTCGTLWFNGDRAKLVEGLPEDVLQSKLMWLIRRYMGAAVHVPEPLEMIRSSWYSNKFTRGSYSYDNTQTPQHPTARQDLGAPLTDATGAPRLLFAGEATDITHFSTVHGAVDSGRREAARILQYTTV